MKKTYILILTFLLTAIAFANNGKDSTVVAKKIRTFKTEPAPAKLKSNVVSPIASKTLKSRSFKSLDKQIDANFFSFKNRAQEFTNEYMESFVLRDSTINEHLAKAVGTFDALEENGNFIESLQPTDLVELPVGIKKTIGGVQYILGISGAIFTPEYTELTAFMRIIIPQEGPDGNQKELFFGANNVRLSHSGGLQGETNLVLLGNVPFAINGGNGLVIIKGGMDMDTGDVTNRTYVTIDCDGFQEMGIEAEVQFPRQMLVPINADNTVDNNVNPLTNKKVKVTGNFQATASDWNDILVEVDLPKFAIAKNGSAGGENNSENIDFIFELNTAVLDFSDIRNSDNVDWPQNYQQDYLVPGNEVLWRGVYVQTLSVALPKQFKNRNNTNRITFQAANLLIDGMGVSGEFSVDNILPLDEGDASKWQFSVDHIEANFVANNMTSAGFNGAIVLPVSKKATAADATAQQQASNNTNQPNNTNQEAGFALAYTAIINPIDDEYILTASPTTAIKFDVWKATATIAPNSYVRFTVADNKFKPEAMLHGSMGIYADNGDPSEVTGNTNTDNSTIASTSNADKTVNFEGITFQNLHLQTESPFVSGILGYNGEVKLANFPVTISNPELIANDTSVSLAFDLAVNLQASQFNAETRLSINGNFTEDEGIQKWKFDGIGLTAISIDANIGGAEFMGSITLMDDDPTYGNGFKGSLTAKFAGMGSEKVTVSANAIFGKTDFRYWYVDALADNLNIAAGGAFKIKGFGGGAFYRMKKVGFSSSFTASGAEYAPDLESGLGIKAMILFSNAANENVFHGGAGFEIAFNSNGGMNRISIYGEGHVMQNISIPNPASKLQNTLAEIDAKEQAMSPEVLEQLKQNELSEVAKLAYPNNVSGKVGLNAYAAIEYDFTSSTLHGSFDLFVDVAGGIFKGRASGNRAGWAVLHFAPETWYVHMGTPTDKLGLRVGVGPLNIETGGYFMVGDQIPGSPPPPAIVSQLLGVDADVLDYMRDENMLGDGRGLAFGMDFSIDTGDMTFLIFYARLQAGVGFDIMVKDYGDTECAGSGPIGIDGWYANGQAYAYIQGEIGVNVKLLFIKKKIPIVTAGLAILMQAKLPNPVWIRGYAGGNFSVLGGLVKGKFRMKVEFGEECEMINGGPLDGLKIISDIQPADGDSEVDVFTVPQVGFNMRVDYPFEIQDDNGNSKMYRIHLKEFKITDEDGEIAGAINWNSNNDLLTFSAEDILPPTTQLTLTVKVNFEEKIGGIWTTIFQDGEEAVEEEIRVFTTGEAPDYIPLNNIAYAYPVIDQKYFHKDEYNQAYIKLKQGQDYLFEVEAGWTQVANFTTNETNLEADLNYDNNANKVFIDLPPLTNSNAYTIALVSLPPGGDEDNNLSESYTDQNLGADTEVEVKNVTLNGSLTNTEAVEMLLYNFNTSEYSTFSDKINAKTMTQPIVEIIYSDVHALLTKHNATEPFEAMELNGNVYTEAEPLLTIEAVLDDNYYQNEIFPLVYQGYPLENQFTVDRDISILNLPPTKAVETVTWYESYLESDPNSILLKERLPYRYNLPFYYKQDFIDIQYKVVNAYLHDTNLYQSQIQQYNYIVNGVFPYIKQGNYNTTIIYTLPGGLTGSSTNYNFNKPN